MKLHRLVLRNFKGGRDVVFEPNGHDADVYGDNATGKTTLADGVFWLLFGKDSKNRADFEIKTLDADGRIIGGLDHSAEGVLELEDGERLTLKRTYREVWETKRGSASRTFSGHTTDYWINSVPVQKKEFDGRVAGVCDERAFRLLTDPNFFNEQLPWQQRRTMLLDLVGDLTDADVIASNPELADLTAILGKHSVEDYRKILAAQRREANDRLKTLPARIDEATRAIPAASATDPKARETARADLNALQERKARLSAGGEVAERQVRLKEVEGDVAEIKRRVQSRNEARQREAREAVQSVERKVADARTEHRNLIARLRAMESEAEALDGRIFALRARFKSESEKGFAGAETCPACGQALPSERIQAATEEFNADKARKLGEIQAEGKALRARFDGLTAEIATAHRAVGEAQALVETAEEASRQTVSIELETPESYPEWQGLLDEGQRLTAEIATLRQGTASAEAELDAQIRAVEARIAAHDRGESDARQAESLAKRIADLKGEETTLAADAERIERELFLTEEFVRTKVSLLTERINDRFALVRFRLFEEQVNGGLAECCEATVNGVPYGSLNHGSRLNAGLDIVNVLAEARRFAPFVIVDNAESVTRILPTKGQQIRLVVSERDKSLRFETRAEEAQGALL